MRYLGSVIDDKSNPGSTDRQPAISAFNERLIAEGYWVFAAAVERWPADGVPPNPGAWLTTTANRKAIDRIRRENEPEQQGRRVVFHRRGEQELV
ncbi:sigma factor [Nonomuraea dietziae]|uniref:Putative RNA polymerase sigma factor n=2 Tax=Nonomuraea dietziae TaxID=65515 RepID=A0A7W5V4H9_9ACTN|nr:sigma factor [Nonomuraea dietziae]MBB3724885.1 putative RNA polymerase sigma factor [Nonomuraea dietziae]